MKALEFFNNTRKECLDDLFDFIRIPSVTRDRNAVKEAADWLMKRLKKTADYVELLDTLGNPVVLAKWNTQNNNNIRQKVPSILFYGHYDVQPPEPLDEWISPPFEPEIRDGRIYARGVGDNKGQLFANLRAIECIHRFNELAVDVIFVFDGEEELGSPNLEKALEKKSELFKDVDLIIISDGPADPTWKPTLEFGARGIQTIQINLQSANEDVHSGNFGGIQPNPMWDLISILKTMRNDCGKCLIEGFYDDVFTPSKAALDAVKELNRNPEVYKQQLGIDYFGEELDQPLSHRVMFRPTFNIRGIQSGSVRGKAKTIIPKDAVIEIDVRLVPNQTPEKIEKLFLAHLDKIGQKSERMAAVIDRCEIKFGASFYPMFTSLELQWTKILEESIEEGFQEKSLKIPLAGGSLPLYSLYKIIKKPIYIIPYAQPDEANHAPNENLMVEWFEKGVKTSIVLLRRLGNEEIEK